MRGPQYARNIDSGSALTMTSSMLLPVRPASPQALREVRRNTPLRQARTCYGHLAGVVGVRLMDQLLSRGWIEPSPVPPDAARLLYSPTIMGADALAERGVRVPAAGSRKAIAFSCVDWTERRVHLGGALGRAIADALVESGCIECSEGSRAVTVANGLDRWFLP